MALRDSLIILKRRGRNRRGRGFSRKELKKAGLSQKQALKLQLPVDLRRRTIHEENVKLLKQQLKVKTRKITKRKIAKKASRSQKAG
ncbi:50S ribosomal protein L13e [Candidatus Bathyarchaeota archaeon]|nr:MAG: 50S ribosomal protein L13e [Candidatus Bathyarchaeota archaeon]